MRFVTRAEWGAIPPTRPAARITSTVTTAHWEGTSTWGGNIGYHNQCAEKVRSIQRYHMGRQGWTDIAYNAVACPHGFVFEGRGPGRRSAANGNNTANSTSAVVCYLGGVGDPFTEAGKQAMSDAAGYLLAPLRKGHRDWYATQCPGDTIYNWVRSGSTPATPEEPDLTAEEHAQLNNIRADVITLHQKMDQMFTKVDALAADVNELQNK